MARNSSIILPGLNELTTLKQRGELVQRHLYDISHQYEEIRKLAELYSKVSHFRVSIFGSARLEPETDEYLFLVDLAKSIALYAKADIVTGGGPGAMEAANKGLKLACEEESKKSCPKRLGRGHGVRIFLPFEQGVNVHVDLESCYLNFSIRLQHFVNISHGAYFAKGGLGTDLERSLIMQLKQVGHIGKDFPIVLDPFWQEPVMKLYEKMHDDRVAVGKKPLIDRKDLNSVQFSDDIDQITTIFKEARKKWKKWRRKAKKEL